MPWYGWLLLTAGAFIALAAITFRLLRASQRGRRFLALSTRGKVQFGRTLLRDSSVPLPAKLMLFALVGYLAMPFDLIPDFIPVIGQLDDIAVIVIAIALLIVLVPRARFESALDGAEREQALRRRAGARDAEAPNDESE
jgi:uncharacterized membrane protein YkvA (DUF1232 family)